MEQCQNPDCGLFYCPSCGDGICPYCGYAPGEVCYFEADPALDRAPNPDNPNDEALCSIDDLIPDIDPAA